MREAEAVKRKRGSPHDFGKYPALRGKHGRLRERAHAEPVKTPSGTLRSAGKKSPLTRVAGRVARGIVNRRTFSEPDVNARLSFRLP
jgi:hypothetical protein